MKKNVLSDEMRNDLARAKMQRDTSFTQLDRAVLSARVAGATFREISEITGMSVPWVQQVLARVDPEQRDYVKRSRSKIDTSTHSE